MGCACASLCAANLCACWFIHSHVRRQLSLRNFYSATNIVRLFATNLDYYRRAWKPESIQTHGSAQNQLLYRDQSMKVRTNNSKQPSRRALSCPLPIRPPHSGCSALLCRVLSAAAGARSPTKHPSAPPAAHGVHQSDRELESTCAKTLAAGQSRIGRTGFLKQAILVGRAAPADGFSSCFLFAIFSCALLSARRFRFILSRRFVFLQPSVLHSFSPCIHRSLCEF